MRQNFNQRMEAVRTVNGSDAFTHTERRVLVALLTRMPLELSQGRSMRLRDLTVDVFGEYSRARYNQTSKAIRGLIEMNIVCWHNDGSRRAHEQWGTCFVLWPGANHECTDRHLGDVTESKVRHQCDVSGDNSLMSDVHHIDVSLPYNSVPNSVPYPLSPENEEVTTLAQ